MKIHRTLCIFLGIMSTLTFCLQPFLATAYAEMTVNQCSAAVQQNTTSDTIESSDAISNDETSQMHSYLYYGLVIISVLASSFDGGVMSFVDSAALQRVHLSGGASEFGKQRNYGCFGSALGSAVFAMAIRFFPYNNSVSCYTGIFFAYFTLSAMLTVSCYFLLRGLSFTRKSPDEDSSDEISKSVHVIHLLWNTLKKFDTILFLFNVFFHGIIQATLYTFIYLFLQQELDAPTLLFPVSMFVGVVSGSFVYYHGKQLIALVHGTVNAMCVVCLFWAIRCTCIAFLTNPYYVLFTDALNGITYSFATISMMEHTKEISDPAVLTTMSSIVNCLYNYLAYAIASMLGGEVFRLYGGKVLFISVAIASVVWGVVMVSYILVLEYRRRRRVHYEEIK